MLTRVARSISSIGVIGAGQMGTGIGIVAAANAGLPVKIIDQSPEQVKASAKFIENWLKRQAEKGKISDTSAVLQRIQFSNELNSLEDADFVVEAISEVVESKMKVLRLLSSIVKPHTILATNTSSISITKLASSAEKPENVIGMHFMNPVPIMTLVEVIRGLQTSEQALAKTKELAAKMGKVCTLSEDRPGFIANRLLMPYINEAIQALGEGIGTREDIDKTMQLGTNVPMGPLTLADFIGLDTCLFIMQVLHRELGDSKYRPATLLINYVNAGWLGKKTKKGFYEY